MTERARMGLSMARPPATVKANSGIKDGVTRNLRGCYKRVWLPSGLRSRPRSDSLFGRPMSMETKIKLFFDPVGNTLTVWFGDPDQEHLCEETGDDVILMKDRKGQVIGFEKLNFVPLGMEMPLVSFETMATPAR